MISSPINKKIGEKIEYYRLLSKINIKHMAAMLELTETGYRNIERGITEAGITKIFRIAQILKTPVQKLIDIDDNPHQQQSNAAYDSSQDGIYKICIEQYKSENQFLRKRISLMEDMIGKIISE